MIISEKTINLFFSAVKTQGEEIVCKLLRSLSYNDEKLYNFIINTTSKEFGITPELLFSKNCGINNTDVKAIVCFFLKKYLKYDVYMMKNLFHHKNESSIYQYIKRVNELNPKIPYHKDILQKIENCQNLIEDFITNK